MLATQSNGKYAQIYSYPHHKKAISDKNLIFSHNVWDIYILS